MSETSQGPASADREEWKFVLLVTAAYVVVATFATVHHEMWRDELHCWLVVRDSSTPWGVVLARAYDWQPPLWYVLLWFITRATWHPEPMRVVHLAIATTNVVLFVPVAPFAPVVRGLFAFAYFVTYEYAAFTRSYWLPLLLAPLL